MLTEMIALIELKHLTHALRNPVSAHRGAHLIESEVA